MVERAEPEPVELPEPVLGAAARRLTGPEVAAGDVDGYQAAVGARLVAEHQAVAGAGARRTVGPQIAPGMKAVFGTRRVVGLELVAVVELPQIAVGIEPVVVVVVGARPVVTLGLVAGTESGAEAQRVVGPRLATGAEVALVEVAVVANCVAELELAIGIELVTELELGAGPGVELAYMTGGN